jgi:hypothetical protein
MKAFLLAVSVGVMLHVNSALAQSDAQLRPSIPPHRWGDTVRVWTAADSSDQPPARAWPAYLVGGAVIGGVLVASYAFAHCDQNCKDDGALAFAPPFILAGAAVGGFVGLTVGLIVDKSRGAAVGFRITVPAP